MPAEAKGTSAASAKAFVRYWIATLNYSGPSGDSSRLRSLSSPKCVDCDAIGDFIDAVYQRGGAIAGDGWDIQAVRVIDKDNADRMVLDALVQVTVQTVTEAKGKKPRTYPGGRRLKTFWLARNGSAWRVSKLEQSK